MARLTLTFFSLHIACLTLLYIVIGAWLPDTRLGVLLRGGGHAQFAFGMLCILCLVALVDAISNAVAPFAGWARNGLHGWTWRLMMLGQAWLGIVAIRAGIEPLVAGVFFLSAIGAGSIAYLDLLEREEARQREVHPWDGLGG